jgi:hypothetical protein
MHNYNGDGHPDGSYRPSDCWVNIDCYEMYGQPNQTFTMWFHSTRFDYDTDLYLSEDAVTFAILASLHSG